MDYDELHNLKKNGYVFSGKKIEQFVMDSVHNFLDRVPFVWTHGDLTPFNICERGIIDFEDSFMGPLGYDLVTLVSFHFWFPIEGAGPLVRYYDFSDDFKRKCMNLFELAINNALKKLGVSKILC